MIHKITSLTFRDSPLFTVATDQAGYTYRVLYTTGQPPAFYLSAWREDGSDPGYRGRTINDRNPLYAACKEAEDKRREAVMRKQASSQAFKRLESESI